MFLYNLKINGNRLIKFMFIFMLIIILLIFSFGIYKIFFQKQNLKDLEEITLTDTIKTNEIFEISSENYTNILQAVTNNIDSYIGCKIHFTGYVYRVYDLKNNQFILARDMIISSDFKSVIVGFLCEYDKAEDFENGTWIEITGEITKGNYHGDMPIIKITEIKKVDTPNEEFVYPPDESYIPTDSII